MMLKFLLNTQIIDQDVYKNIEDNNPNKRYKVLIVFDDMIADIINKKKLIH